MTVSVRFFLDLECCAHLKGLLNGELSLGSIGRDLDFSGGVNRNVISSVRHPARNSAYADLYDGNTHFLR
jgi:hypothetical protein